MKSSDLVLRGLTYYWRTHAAVVLGVATAVAVLAGALLVGDSVRGSLRDLVFERLGATDQVVVSTGFFREQLADDLRSHRDFGARFAGICPLVVAQGVVTEQSNNRRAGKVRVYGVDDRFWQFHRVSGITGPEDRAALISASLAQELGAGAGASILVRVQRPTDIPLESLFGRKDQVSRTSRLTVRAVVARESLGEFALQPQQGEVRAVFVPLARLQEDLEVGGRVNALLVSSKPEAGNAAADALRQLVRSEARLEDLGLKIRVLDAGHALSLEGDGGLLSDAPANAARETASRAGMPVQPTFTYLANALRSGDREIPYSLVTAIDLTTVRLTASAEATAVRRSFSEGGRFTRRRKPDTTVKTSLPGTQPSALRPPIVLNEWAANDLQIAVGDPVTMEYYVWQDPGRLLTQTAEFQVADVVSIDPADRDLAPVYPGITESPTLEDWDPPFPIDLRRVRRIDEEYWKTYRTTPKAFIPIEVGQQLWRSRYGSMTSIRIAANTDQSAEQVQGFAQRLRATIDPLAMGLAVEDVRAEGLQASRGATDFGEYFVYFSFFLVVSALLLAALFFKLSVEQRGREIGLLRAVGFGPWAVRRLFAAEGFLLSLVGSAVGIVGAIAYASLMMRGLRTWWVDAVGTTALTLHVSAVSLATGAIGGVVAAMVCIWLTLRSLAGISDRSLLAGQLTADAFVAPRARGGRKSFLMAAIGSTALGVGLMTGTVLGFVERTGAFFGAGTALLGACLCLLVFRFRHPGRNAVEGHGWIPMARLGARNATYRPGRSVLAIAVMASATFMLISVDAFRRDAGILETDRHAGVGGYALLVESLIPIVHDPNTREGRATLGLSTLEAATIEPFRVLPGDDASCLNLYEPKNPRIVAPRDSFIAEGRFTFQASLASTDAERANPWLLLNHEEPDGAVPVIGDATSMTYVLHRKLGEDFVMTRGDRPIRLRLVAALSDSIFQGELIMSQAHFRTLFPEQEGYQLLLVETAPDRREAVATDIEEALLDFGAEATSTTERLAEFHQVENTYLSTFQTLGGLGLLLGTIGLGAVLLRNVLERRRELALLQALGYKPRHVFGLVIAENVLLLVSGLLTGTVCALLAIAPVVWDRGGRLPALSLGLLLFGVLVVGLMASIGATAAALRSPLLPALRAE
jgi:ABC-type lipoprotein release transport system permease subunit